MTQDEIIEMAKEANIQDAYSRSPHKGVIAQLETFAKLIAAKEREACAKVCAEDSAQAMDFTYGTVVGGYFAEIIRARGEA